MASHEPSSSSNSEMLWIVTGIVILCVLWAIWTFWKTPIVISVFSIQYAELKLAEMIPFLSDMESMSTSRIVGHLNGVYNPENLSVWEFFSILSKVGVRTKWLTVIFMCIMWVYLLFKMKGDGFTQKFTLDSLIFFQKSYWKTVDTVATYKPKSSGDGLRRQVTPFEWLRDNKIKNSVMGDSVSIDDDACSKVFASQLGEPYVNFEELPLHVQSLVVMFAYQKENQIEKTKFLKEELACIYSGVYDEKTRREKLEALIAPFVNKNGKYVKSFEQVAKKHAYVNSAVLAFYRYCKTHSGVLATAEFLWLKPVDRVLYYALNNDGRMAHHIEGAGVISHFQAEIVAKFPLSEPYVDSAIDGVRQYLKERGVSSDDKFQKPELGS